MRSSLLLGLAVVLVFSSLPPAQAASRLVQAHLTGSDDMPSIEVLSSTREGIDLQFDLPALAEEQFVIEGRTYRSLTIPGGGLLGEEGEPGIPSFTRLIAIPNDADVTIRAVSEAEDELTGIDLLPMQSEDGARFSYSAEAYARDDFGGAPLASTGQPALCRDMRVISVTFQPVRYNPSGHAVRVSHRMRVEVRYQGHNPLNARPDRNVPIPPSFDRLYRELIVNYDSQREGREIANGTYLVICPNDPAVITRLQPLLDWRKRKGFPVRLATTAETGTSRAAIKNFIQNAFDGWPQPPEFVVLVGDASGTYNIPTWNDPFQGGEGDHPYTELAGNDIISDVHLGRLSIGSLTELETIVNKTVSYESTPFVSDPGWFTRACLVGDPSSSGFSTIQVQQWIKTRLRQIGYTEVDTIFGGNFVSQMQTALNRGDTYFCYRGYLGMSGWSNSNTNSMTNGAKMPFAVISTCGTGSFASSTSLSEVFLRAGTPTAPKAAIGCIGTATLSTHTRFNNCYTMGLFQGLLYENQYEMGAAHTRGKTELHLNYTNSDQSSNAVTFSYWNNLMGDPAVECWTAFPTVLSVSHPASVALGSNSMVVTVNDGALPSPGATVCAWKGTETWAVGTTDAAGRCELPLSNATSGTLLLTVTKHDRQPYKADVPVQIQPVFVGYQTSTIDDDNVGESQGNADGRLNPGETAELRVQLKNFGLSNAPAVTALLTSEDPYVTITDGSESFGDIPGNGSAWSADDFGFSLAPGCPDGRLLRFSLNVTSGANQWHSMVELPAVSAALSAGTVTLYNAGNGILDPGETVDMSVRLHNNGGTAANGVTATLSCPNAWITIMDAQGTYGNILQASSSENTLDRFTVSASPETFAGHDVLFTLVTQFNGVALDTVEVPLTIGTRTSDDPLGPDRYGYYAFDNTDTSYPDAPVYNWVEIDASLGGTGTQVQLGDFGTYQDKSRTVDLPFVFQYYGQQFTRATICSNGWIAMGSTYLTDYRNWTIPGAGAPENMLAAFWDDLVETSTGHVYQKYDAANHRWIVEWSRMPNDFGSIETFQMILYDPAHLQTPTGDGVIIFQYNQVQNTDYIDHYATVGIQNRDHTDGLLYSFFDRYPAGAAPLQTGRAVKFMPVAIVPLGTLQGLVGNGSNGNSPIAGAEVNVLENGRTFITGGDGRYGGGIGAGTYTLVASHPGFAADTLENVVIVQQQATTRDFFLTDTAGPEITEVTDLGPSTSFNGPYPIQATVTDFSNIASAKLFYRVNLGGWSEIPMTDAGDLYSASIPSLPSGLVVDYYVWARDGAGLVSTFPVGAPGEFLSFHVTEEAYSYTVEDPGDPGWQMGVPGDLADGGVWIREDPIGTEYLGQIMQAENDHTPDPGVKCFVTGNGSVGGAAGDADVDHGCTTLQSPSFNLSQATAAFLTYWRWYAEGGNSTDDQFAVDISSDGGTTWAPLERVPDTDPEWRRISVDVASLVDLTETVRVRFLACDENSQGLVEAAIDDVVLEVFIPNTTGAPDQVVRIPVFGLQGNRPNPFRQNTTINFSLARPGQARLALYDVQGREVRTLVKGVQPAGPQSLVWDGRDNSGSSLPAGIYFMRLKTEGNSEVRKLIRLE